MTENQTTPVQAAPQRKRPRVAPYWYVIGALVVLCTAVLAYHWITGTTPDRVAFRIGFLNFDVYWYGIWIVGGIALGSYVVAYLAGERAQGVFDATVPADVQAVPLSELGLSEPVQAHLARRKVETLGDLLLTWGFDRRNTGLRKVELGEVESLLQDDSRVAETWLSDAPWRLWNPDHVWNGLIWCLVLGVIGARLYHVLTPSPSMAAVGIESPLDYFRNPYQLINIRSGGLGIYGGIAGGALGLFLYTWRARIPLLAWADLAVVGLVLGQAVGRWGNFFNQELYGRPANLPWSISIDPQYRLPEYANFTHFHPAFLYESLWSFLTFLLLHWLVRRRSGRMLPGETTAVYLVLYAIGRTLLELVRLDSRTLALAGLNLNLAVATAVSLVIALLAILWVIIRRVRRRAAPRPA